MLIGVRGTWLIRVRGVWLIGERGIHFPALQVTQFLGLTPCMAAGLRSGERRQISVEIDESL